MNNLVKSFLLIFTGIVMLACVKEDDLKGFDPPFTQPQNLEEAITNIFLPMVEGDTTVGVAVGLVRGAEKYGFFFGERQKDSGIAPDGGTLFEIGSVTKTFTATILAEMVLDGSIKMDDHVKDYFPTIVDFPSFAGNQITFQHLANHTSSLPRFPANLDEENFDRNNPYKNYTAPMMYAFLDGYTLEHPIGSREEYSNLGMGLLGHTMGKIKSTSFNELLLSSVGKMGMHQSVLSKPPQLTNYAQPYDGDLKAVPMWDMSEITLGAGGLKSSIDDMTTYLQANMGSLSTPMNDAIALTHLTTQDLNYPFAMGLGWSKIIKESDNTELIWHDGGTAGTVTLIAFVKQLNIGVILFFNTEINERTGEESPVALTKAVQAIEAMKQF